MCEPILKWVGGKRQLLPEILPRLPEKIATYYEPFIGGGAVFFALAAARRFERAVIGDMNAELVTLYTVTRDRVDELISALRGMPHSQDDYYRVRASEPTEPVERAARLVYLNRTCFNGLYRVNKAGKFNVPFGRFTNPTICDEPRLRAASEALQGVEIVHGDFETLCRRAKSGDAVYLDPPYLPASDTANFAAYQAGGFNVEETRRLARACDLLEFRGVPFLLSNADTPTTRRVFERFEIASVQARRQVNRDATKRGAVGEILVSGKRESLHAEKPPVQTSLFERVSNG